MMNRPNFLVIVADDLGFSDVGAYGGEIKTPNIDRLARGGARFTDFHAASACSPTRSMLLSGTDNHIAGLGTMAEDVQDNQKNQPGYEGYLNDRVAALPELLQDHGYHTLMSGKWHLGLTPDRWPCTRGFDRSYTLLTGAANHYGWEPQLQKSEEKPSIMSKINVYYAEDDQHIGPEDLRPDFYSSEDFTSKLIEYLSDHSQNEETKSNPFFAYLAYSAPHWPLQAPDEDIQDHRGVYDDGPEVLRQRRLAKLKELGLIPDHAIPHDVIAVGGEQLSRDWDTLDAEEKRFSTRTMECFAGMVQNMDKQIGRVLDHLTQTGELENTVVLFMSDNGAEGLLLEAIPLIKGDVHDHIAKYYDNSLDNLGRKNSFIWYGPHWASAATAPGRLFKLFTTEGGVRVPLILNYPPLIDMKGTIDHSFGTVMDVMPTLLELAGVNHPGTVYKGRPVVPMRGKSWVQYLQGQRKQIHGDDFVMGWELYGRQAIRQGDYKAVYIPKPYGPEKWQLYNLKQDPGETNDLGELMPRVLKTLLLEWDQYALDVGMIAGGNMTHVEAK